MATRGLIPRHFHAAIKRHADPVNWYRALPNPAHNQMTNEFDRAATDSEFGFLYAAAVADTENVFLYQQQEDMMDEQFGLVRKGEMVATTNPEVVNLAQGDKLECTAREEVATEVVERGSGATDALSMPTALELSLVMMGETEYDIAAASLANPDSDDGDCQLGADVITWISGGSAPAEGNSYGARYAYRPTFWVTGTAMVGGRPSRRDRVGADGPSGAGQRKQLFVQRAHLVLRRPSEGAAT